MSLGYDANAGDESTGGTPEEPVANFARQDVAVLLVQRSRLRDSWDWIWKDTLQRVVPLTLAGIVAARLFERERGAGFALVAGAGVVRECALGLAVGVPLAAVTVAFRAWVAPGYRLPTRADQAAQTVFYLAVNAPAEELFWRGTVQRVAVGLLGRLPPLRPAAKPLGWALATAGYALYHRLGGWSWRSIAGVSFAGAVFGALYQSRPRDRALVGVTIAHGLATASFLSWGDVALHWRRLRRARQRAGDRPLRVMEAPGERRVTGQAS